MRSAAFAAAALLALTVALGGLRQTKAEDSQPRAITDCAHMGAAVQGDCTQASLDSTPGFIVSHTVLAGACGGRDLHLVRYLPARRASDTPLVATYCSA